MKVAPRSSFLTETFNNPSVRALVLTLGLGSVLAGCGSDDAISKQNSFNLPKPNIDAGSEDAGMDGGTGGGEDVIKVGDPCHTGLPGQCDPGVLALGEDGLPICKGNVLPVPETCNGVDDDCDGLIDKNPTDGVRAYPDMDGDNFGDKNKSLSSCNPAAEGLITIGGDCDDNNPLVHPGVSEACNGVDDDCNGQTDEGNPGGDASCDTGNPGICTDGTTACVSGVVECYQKNEPQLETCNGVDDNCDGKVDMDGPGGPVTFAGKSDCVNTNYAYVDVNDPFGQASYDECHNGVVACANAGFEDAISICKGEGQPAANECNYSYLESPLP